MDPTFGVGLQMGGPPKPVSAAASVIEGRRRENFVGATNGEVSLSSVVIRRDRGNYSCHCTLYP